MHGNGKSKHLPSLTGVVICKGHHPECVDGIKVLAVIIDDKSYEVPMSITWQMLQDPDIVVIYELCAEHIRPEFKL